MPDSFYVPEGDGGFRATKLTRGPWDAGAQHAGPPAALLGREVERLDDGDEFQVGRITFEICRSVPIAPVRAQARIVRPGRRVQLVEATLSHGGDVLIRAAAWRIRTSAIDLPDHPRPHDPPLPGPEEGEEVDFFPTGQPVGYHTAMEYRFVSGSFLGPGPATVWMRPRQPLVAGEEVSPLQRVLVAADSGNGVSAALDWRRWLFINVDLTVQLERLPEGEWVCLDAATRPGPNGIGSADTLLHDERGRIGRALQTLLVSER
ncbi:MAG TPA: thioesterase family protein [Solirubrobacterales bacterium]|nr:thioesterase family protein [Solirubrobacterales bacterium]